MAIIRSTVKVGQKPPKEVIMRIKEIAKKPIHYTEDCPESGRKRCGNLLCLRRNATGKIESWPLRIRLVPDCREKYNALRKAQSPYPIEGRPSTARPPLSCQAIISGHHSSFLFLIANSSLLIAY
jgi:hypothetical protein